MRQESDNDIVVIVDSHHHFIDTRAGNHDLVKSVAGEVVYLAEDYERDVKDRLKEELGVELVASIHVECMPNNGAEEVRWVEECSKSKTVKAIVGSVNLASPDVEMELQTLVSSGKMVKGVRWILDCVGPYQPGTATHVATTRHDGIDYLRGGKNQQQQQQVMDCFENGYKLLETYQLSFDLQCAPAQLLMASQLASRYPNIPVVIDHLGKPRTVIRSEQPQLVLDEEEISVWRKAMKAMAALPHVYVKLSMLGYIVPGWIQSKQRESVIKDLVLETIHMFGPQRCMFALNWYLDGAISDSDGLSSVGPDAIAMYEKLKHWLLSSSSRKYTPQDLHWIFAKTAQTFYRIPP